MKYYNRQSIKIKVEQAVGARSSKLSKILNLLMNTDLHSSLFDLVNQGSFSNYVDKIR